MKRKSRRRLRLPRSLRATRAGWCFVAIIFGVGFAALNTGNNLLYLVLSLMLAFLVLSGLLSESSLRGLRVARRLPREIFAAAPNRVRLRISNDHPRFPAFAVSVQDRIESEAGIELAGRVFALRIGPQESADRGYAFEPRCRGAVDFLGCRISTRFPFGLFVKSVDLDLEASAVVYPQVFDTASPTPVEHTRRSGDDPQGRSPDGDEIGGVREYLDGDSMQRIHWRRSIRERRLIVGEREGEESPELEILLRLPSTLSAAEVEERVAQTTTQVVRQLENGSRVGLRTPRYWIATGAGFAHRTELLCLLARIEPEAPSPTEATPTTDASQDRG